jgi:DNA polymerase III subunit delta
MAPKDSPGIEVEVFRERVRTRKPISSVLLLGNEAYLRDLCRKDLIEAFTDPAARDWAVVKFSAGQDSVDAVVGQAQTLPMLVAHQVIVFSDVQALEKLGEKNRDAACDLLEGYFKDPAPFSTLVFEASALDARMRPFKILSAKTVVVSCALKSESEAAGFAEQMASDSGIKLDRDAARQLAEYANADLARIQTEITKLSIYAGDRKQITAADVALLVVSEKRYTVWQLSEMLASCDRERSLRFLASLLHEGEQPVMIVGAMAWMFRKLLEAQSLPRNADPWQAARQLVMQRDTAVIALRECRRMTTQQLRDGLVLLAEADNQLKSGVAAPKAMMEFLVTQLATRRATATAGNP